MMSAAVPNTDCRNCQMPPFIETIAFVFGLVAFGYSAGWSGILKPDTGDALADFVFVVAVPLLLFKTMATASFGDAAPWALWIAYYTAAAVAWIAGQLSVVRVFGRDRRAGVVGGIAAAFSNNVLIGIPFMLGVFGQEGFRIISLIIAIHLPIMMASSIILYQWAQRGEKAESPASLFLEFLNGLLRNPLIIGIVAGLAWRFTGMDLSGLTSRYVDALAGVAGPVALFSVGLALRKFGLTGNAVPALVISQIKLILMPAVALAMAWILELPPVTAMVVVAAASMPTGINPYLVASRFGTGQALASNTMIVATALAAFTTAFWLLVAQQVFG